MFPFLRGAAKGAFVTFGGTVVSCGGALIVERQAHRTLFRLFPHWYRDVEYAFGIESYELEAVRRSTSTTTKDLTTTDDLKENPDWVENILICN